MTQVNDGSFFYKYMSACTAKVVLSTSSLKWSSPLEFNDPFDHPTGGSFSFSKDEFIAKFDSAINRLVYDEINISLSNDRPLGKVIISMRQNKKKEEIDSFIERCKTNFRIDEYRKKYNDMAESCVKKQRVFCVSKRKDNIVMWSHYASSHGGAVLTLQNLNNNKFTYPKKVEYKKKFPAISLDEFIKDITSEKTSDFKKLADQIAITKYIDWSYEDEWRMFVTELLEETQSGYNILPIDPSHFSAILLGYRMEENNKTEIINLVRENFNRKAKISGACPRAG